MEKKQREQEQEPIYINDCEIVITEYLKNMGYMNAVLQLQEIDRKNKQS